MQCEFIVFMYYKPEHLQSIHNLAQTKKWINSFWAYGIKRYYYFKSNIKVRVENNITIMPVKNTYTLYIYI